MIQTITQSINRSEGIEVSIQHHIKQENLGIIFGILRKQLYSNPMLATIREICANAQDAHVMVGKPTLPIRVSLPNTLDSFLKVRDFGPGLNDEDIQSLYSGYGDSGKRHSNSFVGGFGIGKHAPLALTDSFIINSYQNGVLSSWNSFIDTTQQGKISKMGHFPTTEPDGLEIIVPIKDSDINTCHTTAINLFAWYDVLPSLVGTTAQDKASLEEFKNRKAILEGVGYKYFGNRDSKVLMGGVPYAISSSVFTNGELQEAALTALNNGIVLYANIGELEVAASRETLNYTPETKKKLATILNGLVTDLIAKGNDLFKNCKSLWEAKILYAETFNSGGALYAFKNFLEKNVTFNGVKIGGRYFRATSYMDNVVHIQSYSPQYGDKIKKQFGENLIQAGRKFAIVENDLHLENGIINRVIGLLAVPYGNHAMMPAYETVYVIDFKDTAAKTKWIQESGFDGPMELISNRPKEFLSTYYGSNATGGNAVKNSKHSTKEFVLDVKGSITDRNKNSDYFTKQDVDVETDSGIYIMIDGFYCESKGGYGYNEHPKNLITYLNWMESIGITVPVVYAFKKSCLDLVSKNANMVNVWKWMKAEVDKFFADPAQQTIIANWQEMKNAKRNCNGIEHFEVFQNAKIGPNSNFRKFLLHLGISFNKSNQTQNIDAKEKLINQFGINIGAFKATVNVVQEFKATKKKYPLVFGLVEHVGYDSDNLKEYMPEFEEYIKMVDAKNLPVATSNGVV